MQTLRHNIRFLDNEIFMLSLDTKEEKWKQYKDQ